MISPSEWKRTEHIYWMRRLCISLKCHFSQRLHAQQTNKWLQWASLLPPWDWWSHSFRCCRRRSWHRRDGFPSTEGPPARTRSRVLLQISGQKAPQIWTIWFVCWKVTPCLPQAMLYWKEVCISREEMLSFIQRNSVFVWKTHLLYVQAGDIHMHNAGFHIFQPVLVLEVEKQVLHHLSCDSHQLIT